MPDALGALYQHPNVTTFPIEGEDAKMTFVVAWKNSNDNPAFRIFMEAIF